MERLCVSVEEAADMLGICRTTAYKKTQSGELPTVRVGRRVLVPVRALENWLHLQAGV